VSELVENDNRRNFKFDTNVVAYIIYFWGREDDIPA